MDIQAEADALVERNYRSQINPETRSIIYADASELIHRWYAEGGYILDNCEQPIWDVDDVGIAVSIGGNACSIAFYRRERHSND